MSGNLKRDRIPEDAMAAARAFRDSVLRADEQFSATLATIRRPLVERLTRKRDLRPEAVIGTLRLWKERVAPMPFHLAWDAKADRRMRSLTITEVRLAGSLWLDRSWELPGQERSVSLIRLTMTAGDGRLNVRVAPIVCFSLHALSRRFQRARDWRDASVVADLSDCLRSENWFEAENGEQVIDVANGRWLGETTSAGADRGQTFRLHSIRTFVGSAQLRVRGARLKNTPIPAAPMPSAPPALLGSPKPADGPGLPSLGGY